MSVFQFPQPTPVFPFLPGLTYSTNRRPTWATLEYVAVSGRRVTSPQQAFPLWEFELKFDYLKDQTQNIVPDQTHAGRHDFTKISQLFLACAGKYGQFYLDDPDDDSRYGQLIGTGNGSQTAFTIVRTWGLGGVSINEPVGGINVIENVYLNGVAVDPVNYSFSTNILTFNTAPALGVVITMDFYFYYLCQFLEDQHDYEEFMRNLHTLKSCKLRSIKL